MQLHFTKMQGAGNDYIYVNGFTQQVPQEKKPQLARTLSDRHFGIGGDGLIFINPSPDADFEMEMYNADGSRGEMCGNGMRCVGKYVYDHGMTGDDPDGSGRKEQFTVASCGIVRQVTVVSRDSEGLAETLCVNMGAPILEAEKIPVIATHSPVINEPIEVAGQFWHMTCVSMGNPHAVVFVEDTDILDLPLLGPQFEHHARFPKRINTEFVQVLSPARIRMRVWERGAGETLACGTGCCASTVACVLNQLTDVQVEVEVPGGIIQVKWDRDRDEVYMSGPAAYSFEGVTTIE